MAEEASTTPNSNTEEVLELWRTESDPSTRDDILQIMREKDIFPQAEQDEWEQETGLYPDLDDPNFIPKLMRKREFQDSKQPSVKESYEDPNRVDKCRTTEDFELSPVQRFVSRLINPRTPYHSALLFHGVGVGKTCAAVTICESYLAQYPGRKAFVVAPPNIQYGFKRTLFDTDALTLGKEGAPNHHRGCTGDIYLDLTGNMYEKDKEVIENNIVRKVNQRYEFFGYASLYNFIHEKYKTLTESGAALNPRQLETQRREIIRRVFSNRVLVIDEAHNLRDNPAETDEDLADDASIQDSKDSKAGKKLTPFLREVLEVAEGITLVLMTATPMYNSYLEIIFLLNLLLLNDKRPEIRVSDIFDTSTQKFKPGGEEKLGRIASTYISFMRGENPLTFPLRLEPEDPRRVVEWPSASPRGDDLIEAERERCTKLPILQANFEATMDEKYYKFSEEIVTSKEGLGITNMDTLVQAGNWIFPGEDEDEDIINRVQQRGFDVAFSKETRGKLLQYRCNESIGAEWLLEENLPSASPKCALLLERLNNCKGVAFIYSRFVATGALSIALALEANGYLPYGRDGLLADGNQHPEGRQCAFCTRRERGHGKVAEGDGIPEHEFVQARYVLLTGSKEISPNNAGAIRLARASKNYLGQDVKVVIGSQIAGEGLDLRFIREVFVFDSWYHLNKLEQIIGRGIRNCSHAALPENKRNCTISLLVNRFGEEMPDIETADLYSYRLALSKARVVGMVTRVLKEYAMDCSLNHDAIVVAGMEKRTIIDSQGDRRENVDINDVPLTPLCDWLETCEYECRKGDGEVFEREIGFDDIDTSTYDEYTAQFQKTKIKNYLQELISKSKQGFIQKDAIVSHFKAIPETLIVTLLGEIVMDKTFKIKTERGEGRIIYKNGYYLFQPDAIQDTNIPLAIRLMKIPVPRDSYGPTAIEPVRRNAEGEGADEDDSEEVWEEAKKWATKIRGGAAMTKVPPELLKTIESLRTSAGSFGTIKERLHIVIVLYNYVRENNEARRRFADVVLQFIWDEFLTTGTRRNLIVTSYTEDWIKVVAPDVLWEYEGRVYIRILNASKNTIEYFCPAADGTVAPCSKAIIEVLEKISSDTPALDPILEYPLNTRNTGYKYGFLAFNEKKKALVYKRGEPPAPGKKLARGAECSINSQTTNERKALQSLGETMREADIHDLGINETNLRKEEVKNSVRICTVTDLVLRYMDRNKIGGKRWFYRPLEAKVYKHPLR